MYWVALHTSNNAWPNLTIVTGDLLLSRSASCLFDPCGLFYYTDCPVILFTVALHETGKICWVNCVFIMIVLIRLTHTVYFTCFLALFLFLYLFVGWQSVFSLKRNIRNSFIKILMPEWIDLSTLNTKSQGIKWTLELNIFDFTETARIWTKKMIKSNNLFFERCFCEVSNHARIESFPGRERLVVKISTNKEQVIIRICGLGKHEVEGLHVGSAIVPVHKVGVAAEAGQHEGRVDGLVVVEVGHLPRHEQLKPSQPSVAILRRKAVRCSRPAGLNSL